MAKHEELKPASSRTDWAWIALVLAFLILVGTNAYTFRLLSQQMERNRSQARQIPATFDSGLRDFRVVNAHDHLFSRSHLAKYLDAAKETGVVKTLLVASSEYTLMGAGRDQAKGNHENTLEILAAAAENPSQLIGFCAVHPDDAQKLERLKFYVAQGARGLKLYTGHGNFYQHPLDWDGMEELYAYCDETRLPICWHVNITRYLAEFERVMQKHPNMIVIVPHFGVTFFRPRQQPFREFQRLLDTYPNLYTDTSFGTRGILVSGLEAVSGDVETFRAFFEKYSDRILFGTDMVITGNKEKTQDWIAAVLWACRDVLEKETFHFYMGAKGSPYASKKANNIYGAYRGLNLSDDILRKIYETNINQILPPQP
ncbi:MAG TPA: amidohydrolase family protein [Candidatus Bathyarchaeia archaeon]|nr:amidohydrolase family protein [Candidatus Bathyarchaeia archaeon]